MGLNSQCERCFFWLVVNAPYWPFIRFLSWPHRHLCSLDDRLKRRDMHRGLLV